MLLDHTSARGLGDARQRLHTAQSVDAIFTTLKTSARGLLGSDGIALILRDGDLCHYVEEDAIGPLWKGKKFSMAACISGWAMLNGQTAVIPNIYEDKRIPQDLYESTFVRSLVMTPIRMQPAVGALGSYWADQHDATASEIATIVSLAQATGEALQRVGSNG